MPSLMSKLASGAHCRCNNDDPLKFRRLRDPEDEFIGLHCLKCNSEYLNETFSELIDRQQHVLRIGRERFYLANTLRILKDNPHAVPILMKPADNIKPGDHIATMSWHKYVAYWHHFIVTQVSNEDEIKVICWGNSNQVVEEPFDLQKHVGKVCRMDYPEDVVKANPAHLVLARARSRLGEKRCSFSFKNNSENLATSCKLGFSKNIKCSYKFYLEQEDLVHMVHSDKTKIDLKKSNCVTKELKPGDHIAWNRSLGHWHHAIVTEIGQDFKIKVIHWHNKSDPIVEEWIDLQEEQGSLYRMDYQDKIVKANPVELVLKRARKQVGREGYNLLWNNCEDLATYCKTGFAISQQIRWVRNELAKELAKNGGRTLLEVFVPELGEYVLNASQVFGAGFLAAFETLFTASDLYQFCQDRKSGKLSKHELVKEITTRITQAILGGGLAILGGLVPIPGLNFLLGFIGGTLGKWLGSMIGPRIGNFLVGFSDYNDRAICQITDLQSGDHLVLEYGSEGSHHCILQYYYEEKNQINIIHNTEKDGITQEWIDFVQPVYKVIYDGNDSYTPDEIWSRAVSRVGVNEYNAKTNNSKHFAQWCCRKTKNLIIIADYDRAVPDITDLRSGDHLVHEYGSEVSHHCILQWYDEEKNQINIIHNTEKDGITQEWIDFVQPVYKVIYAANDCYTPDEVFSRAVSRVGVNEYNAKTNNSKHFAQWCCRKNNDQ